LSAPNLACPLLSAPQLPGLMRPVGSPKAPMMSPSASSPVLYEGASPSHSLSMSPLTSVGGVKGRQGAQGGVLAHGGARLPQGDTSTAASAGHSNTDTMSPSARASVAIATSTPTAPLPSQRTALLQTLHSDSAKLPTISRLHFKEAPTTTMRQSPLEDTFVLRAAEGDLEDVIRRLARGQNINATHSVRPLALIADGTVTIVAVAHTRSCCDLMFMTQRLRCSALHAAAEKGAIEMMRFLVKSGAVLNITQEVTYLPFLLRWLL
jgi:hypothetical protein